MANQTLTKKKNRGGAYSNLGLSSEIKEGRGSNLSEWPVENLFKIFFKLFGSIVKLERGILSQNGEMENVLTIQRQIREI